MRCAPFVRARCRTACRPRSSGRIERGADPDRAGRTEPGRGACLSRRGCRRRSARPPSTRRAAATRSISSSSRGRSTSPVGPLPPLPSCPLAIEVPSAVAASLTEELALLSDAGTPGAWKAPRWRATRSSPSWPRPRRRRRRFGDGRDRRAPAARSRSRRPTCRGASASGTRSCGARSTRPPRRLATRCARAVRRGARGARRDGGGASAPRRTLGAPGRRRRRCGPARGRRGSSAARARKRCTVVRCGAAAAPADRVGGGARRAVARPCRGVGGGGSFRREPRGAAGGDRDRPGASRPRSRATLTTACARVERFLGRYEEAHARLARALRRPAGAGLGRVRRSVDRADAERVLPLEIRGDARLGRARGDARRRMWEMRPCWRRRSPCPRSQTP